jgi:signal transduction histidine kinase
VIAEVVALTHHEVQQQQVQMRTDVGGDLPLVVGDRIQVQQVLLNLVLNGLDALRPILDRPRTLLIRAGRLGAETVRVTVQDSGIGVDPPMLERMFAPFVTTKPAGLGMGLAISRTIIEAHGGRLWAEPHADHGITVHFTLPTAGEHAHA